jgi:multiple sugar transport system substrate-binding protein
MKVRRLRSLGVIAASAGLVITLAAAGTSTSAAPVAKAKASAAPVTLVLGNSQWLDALRGKNLWNAMLEYEKVAPNVTLKQEAIPSADFATKITTELGAGQGPDVIMMQDGLFATEAAAKALVPLTSVAKAAKKLNATNDAGKYDGTVYGMAWQRAAYALVYNKTLIKKAGIKKLPTTVTELIADAKQVTAKTGAIGFATRHLASDPSGWYMDFDNWVAGYGGSWAKNGKITINTKANVAALTAYEKMYKAKVLPFGDDMPTMRTRFEQGQVGFIIDNSGGALNMASAGPLTSAEVGAAPLPFPEPASHQQLLVGVNKNSKSQKAAKAFVSWLVSAKGQTALRGASGPDGLATDVPLTTAFSDVNSWGAAFAKVGPDSKSLLIPGFEAKTPAIMAAVMGAVETVIASGASPKAALAAAQPLAVAASK